MVKGNPGLTSTHRPHISCSHQAKSSSAGHPIRYQIVHYCTVPSLLLSLLDTHSILKNSNVQKRRSRGNTVCRWEEVPPTLLVATSTAAREGRFFSGRGIVFGAILGGVREDMRADSSEQQQQQQRQKSMDGARWNMSS